MPTSDSAYFQLLKDQVAATFLQNHTASSVDIRQWKGQDIVDFQEDLFQTTRGRISEKWFYTHMKSESEKLPRIDMLNLLSAYIGCENWAAFKQKNALPTPPKTPTAKPTSSNKRYLTILVAVALVLGGLWWLIPGQEAYTFCFIDADREMAITNQPLEIEIWREGESPQRLQTDSNGCLQIPSPNGQLRFVVRGAYYRTDTITRVVSGAGSEQVALRTNDYALMIHLFSTADRQGWERRRLQLDQMFAPDAEIYQVGIGGRLALDLHNKEEFINKLTMPIPSLKNIEVIETLYRGSQIIKMRFRVREEQP
ncbi:MAG: hypothetical protein ACFB10_16170 [Salibacteraceae bacterium]